MEAELLALGRIRTGIREMAPGQQADWAFVRKNFGQVTSLKNPAVIQLFWSVFKELIDAFEIKKLSDQSLITDVLQLGSFTARYYNSSDEKLQNALSNLNMGIPMSTGLNNAYIQILRKHPYFMSRELTCPYFDIVWMGCKDGHELLVTALLSNGVQYVPEYDCRKGWYECGMTARSLFGVNTMSNISATHIKDIFESSNSFSRVRIYAIFRALEMLALTLDAESSTDPDPDPTKYFRCFRKVFQTIPDILVTILEVRQVLEHVAKRWDSSLNLKSKVDGLCMAFKLHYPESIEPKQPRRLKDTVLVQLRDYLRRADNFPHGMHQLRIPTTLKNAMILKD